MEKEFEIIQADNDEEDEARISNFLIQNKNALIEDLQANLNKAKSVIDTLDLENRQLAARIAIYEAKAFNAQKEAQRAQVKLEEFIGTYEESEDEEG